MAKNIRLTRMEETYKELNRIEIPDMLYADELSRYYETMMTAMSNLIDHARFMKLKSLPLKEEQ